MELQPDASCRRARPPSTSLVIAESGAESGDESCALSAGASTQPLDVESIIARWTSIAYCGPCICCMVSGAAGIARGVRASCVLTGVAKGVW